MSNQRIFKTLQRRLAEIDLFYEPRNDHRSKFTELLLVRLKDLKLKIYQEIGHALPHIHIDYGGKNHVATFAINHARRIEGSLHSKYDKAIITWITENKEALLHIWDETQKGGNPHYLIEHLSAEEQGVLKTS